MSTAATDISTSQADGLEAHVEAVTLSLQALAVLLVRERDALTDRAEAPDLERIAGDKQEAVEHVGMLYARLRESMEALCGPSTTMSESLPVLKRAHPRLAEGVDRLVRLTRECQRANQDNGVLVSTGLRNARGALETLRHVGAEPVEPGTYGPSGIAVRGAAVDRLRVRA